MKLYIVASIYLSLNFLKQEQNELIHKSRYGSFTPQEMKIVLEVKLFTEKIKAFRVQHNYSMKLCEENNVYEFPEKIDYENYEKKVGKWWITQMGVSDIQLARNTFQITKHNNIYIYIECSNKILDFYEGERPVIQNN